MHSKGVRLKKSESLNFYNVDQASLETLQEILSWEDFSQYVRDDTNLRAAFDLTAENKIQQAP